MSTRILIKCGKLFHGENAKILTDVDVLVADDRIVSVGVEVTATENTKVIDLSDSFVTPGLIDAHVHPEFFDWRHVYENYAELSDETMALATLHTAQEALKRGFTSLRVLGSLSRGYGLVDVKRAIDAGYFDAARLVVSAHGLTVTGGHGDLSKLLSVNPLASKVLQSPSAGTGADYFVEQVRREVKYGSDFIKLLVSGGFSLGKDSPSRQEFTDAELVAIFEIAKNRGIPVTAHAYSPEIIQKLIRLGIPGIEHGSLMDEETARMMEDNDIYLVSTFSPFDKLLFPNEAEPDERPAHVQEKMRSYAEKLRVSREIIVKSNIRLGYGSDHVQVRQNYESAYEYASLLRSGMTPLRALRAATSVNAAILGRDDELGRLQPGKVADIAAWPLDLFENPDALFDCRLSMKAGKAITLSPKRLNCFGKQ